MKKKTVRDNGKILSGICFALIIGFWCIATYGGLISDLFLPSPTEVVKKIIEMADFWMEKGECETDDLTDFFELIICISVKTAPRHWGAEFFALCIENLASHQLIQEFLQDASHGQSKLGLKA